MTIEEISLLLANNLFPVAVSTYLLIYMHAELKKLTEILVKLSEKIDKISS